MAATLAVAAFVASMAGATGLARADSSKVELPDCNGEPQYRPTSIVLTCADANIQLVDLHWTGWGESFAAAMGAMSANDCQPTCVAGHTHRYRVLVTATGSQTCPGGEPAYLTITYAFVGASPWPANSPGARSPSQDFVCKHHI